MWDSSRALYQFMCILMINPRRIKTVMMKKAQRRRRRKMKKVE